MQADYLQTASSNLILLKGKGKPERQSPARKSMKYAVKVNEVKNEEGNIRGFAQVVFGESFKITNIAILENRETGKLFVSMPRYRSNERDEQGNIVYKDVCNPITAEFRKELYDGILKAYEALKDPSVKPPMVANATEMPEFSVKVTPYERDGSNIRGLARIYFEDCFVVNNVNLLQGKEKIFIAMPAYKTKKVDEQGKAVYQDICYPVTKEFREKLNTEIEREYEKAKQMNESKTKGNANNFSRTAQDMDMKETPFR